MVNTDVTININPTIGSVTLIHHKVVKQTECAGKTGINDKTDAINTNPNQKSEFLKKYLLNFMLEHLPIEIHRL